ncbi:hypothetical protein BU26DRAFT_319218 [Trematosphaeria pertusa]|uniref:Uncharacterized protein n=1 Tax=Trematosphaeria pertusa TaxID=390896 RepID=A0A6A6IG20_9PLEO|nr:uncharacterized protein BU26DRAFT_319218 [Trematosphaeria pertusa]KAF2249534.1 hypothetical protein BU26DRAFT_319218 [Trematosphaeria pertusa]
MQSRGNGRCCAILEQDAAIKEGVLRRALRRAGQGRLHGDAGDAASGLAVARELGALEQRARPHAGKRSSRRARGAHAGPLHGSSRGRASFGVAQQSTTTTPRCAARPVEALPAANATWAPQENLRSRPNSPSARLACPPVICLPASGLGASAAFKHSSTLCPASTHF